MQLVIMSGVLLITVCTEAAQVDTGSSFNRRVLVVLGGAGGLVPAFSLVHVTPVYAPCTKMPIPLHLLTLALMACPLCCWSPERDPIQRPLSNNGCVLAVWSGLGMELPAALHPQFKLMSSLLNHHHSLLSGYIHKIRNYVYIYMCVDI